MPRSPVQRPHFPQLLIPPSRLYSAIVDSSSRCASAASTGCGQDSAPTAALHRALSAFLLETPCHDACWQQPQPGGGGGGGGGGVLAIVLLAALVAVLAGVLGVVSYRTSCFRIPMTRG